MTVVLCYTRVFIDFSIGHQDDDLEFYPLKPKLPVNVHGKPSDPEDMVVDQVRMSELPQPSVQHQSDQSGDVPFIPLGN